MILTRIKPHVLGCGALSGNENGKFVLISQISLEPLAEDVPVRFKCHQFPVQLAFSMTVNKFQCQSVANIGLDLWTPLFSHGQLYVALSHCTSQS